MVICTLRTMSKQISVHSKEVTTMHIESILIVCSLGLIRLVGVATIYRVIFCTNSSKAYKTYNILFGCNSEQQI